MSRRNPDSHFTTLRFFLTQVGDTGYRRGPSTVGGSGEGGQRKEEPVGGRTSTDDVGHRDGRRRSRVTSRSVSKGLERSRDDGGFVCV